MNLQPLSAPATLAAELHRGHVLLMKTAAVANLLLEQSNVPGGGVRAPAALAKIMAAQGMAGLSARLGERLHSVRKTAGRLAAKGIDPVGLVLPAAPVPETRSAAPARARLHAAPGQARGRLKNGNPSGDYLAAPRCGARARSGCPCRQPAMASPRAGGGRCRFHGGKSTGARTPEGLRICRNIRFRHGGRSRPVIALRSRAVHAARHLRALHIYLRAAGHGVGRSFVDFHPASGASSVGATGPRTLDPGVPLPENHRRSSAFIGGQIPSSAGRLACRSASREGGDHLRLNTLSAGHGVDRSFPDFPSCRPGALARAAASHPLRV